MSQLKNLYFSYGNEQIIKNLSLELPKSGIISIMGPSGCGKSTLLSLIAGVLKPESGEIDLDFKRIAVSFQNSRLLPWYTALENVNYALGSKKSTLQKAKEILATVGLADDADKYPRELSGGMQRRVSLARALVTEPDFLLLDEPFSGLDNEIKNSILDHLKALSKNMLILLITHDREEALFCSDLIYDFEDLNEK